MHRKKTLCCLLSHEKPSYCNGGDLDDAEEVFEVTPEKYSNDTLHATIEDRPFLVVRQMLTASKIEEEKLLHVPNPS